MRSCCFSDGYFLLVLPICFPGANSRANATKQNIAAPGPKVGVFFGGDLTTPVQMDLNGSKWDNSSGAIKSKVHGNHITNYDMFSKASGS